MDSLTLDLWSSTDGPPCPRCGAAGDAWSIEDEIFVFDCACGSRAEVANEPGFLEVAYGRLIASCPVFIPPSPRRRLWEHAE